MNFLLYPKITGYKVEKKNLSTSEHLEKIIFKIVPHPGWCIHKKTFVTLNISHIKGVRDLTE